MLCLNKLLKLSKINTKLRLFNSNYSKSFSQFFSFQNSSFSEKDDAFWEEYTKRKEQGGKIPALPSQDIVINKVETEWRYAGQHSLKTVEFHRILQELKPNTKVPFVIVDVREEIEFDIYKLPKMNKVIRNI